MKFGFLFVLGFTPSDPFRIRLDLLNPSDGVKEGQSVRVQYESHWFFK